MSAPANVMQALLAPWMTGGSSSGLDQTFSGYGGAQGLLSALMQGAGPDTPQARTGAAMQNAQTLALANAAARQKLAMGSIGLQQSAAMFPIQMQALQAYAARHGLGGMAAQPGAPTSAPGPAAPGGTVPGGAAPTGGAPAGAPMPQGGSPFGADIDYAGLLAMMKGDPASMLKAVQSNPAYMTEAGVAKDPLTLDRAMIYEAYSRGDLQGAQAAYTKYLSDAKMLNIADRTGTVTTFGGITPQSLGYQSVNPTTGTQMGGGTMSAIPGAPQALGGIAGAEAGARAANTPAVIPTQGGGSRYGYPGDVLGAPPAIRAPGAPVPPAPGAVQGPAAPVPDRAPLPSAKPPKNDPWASIPKINIPQGVGETDFFTRGKLQKAGEIDTELSQKLGDEATLADQQLEYTREARTALDQADTGPASEWLTRNRSMLMEFGFPAKLIPSSGTVVPTQELNKALKNAALQGARQVYGPRMTQTEVKLQTEEMSPSAAMMHDAISSLMQQNDVRNLYAKQRAMDYAKYRQMGGDPAVFESWYSTKFPLSTFARAASSGQAALLAEAKRRGLTQ